LDDLDRAKSLFDWTVRNIQLEEDSPDRIPQFPWETLLFGRGTAEERAWVFILFARQLHIDAALLAIEERGERGEGREERGEKRGLGTSVRGSSGSNERKLRPWCVGVLIEGNVYLFDPSLGLPIPAPHGVSLDEAGRLAIQPATLAQVVADEKLLRQMDFDKSHAYGVKASQLAHVEALIEASPLYLAQRMTLLESRLAGSQKMILSTSPSTIARHWKESKHIAEARLWLRPFETLERRSHLTWPEVKTLLRAILPLYMVHEDRTTGRAARKLDPQDIPNPQEQQEQQARTISYPAALCRGRMLHLKGKFTGEDGATKYYQIARPSNESLRLSSADPAEKFVLLLGKQDASYWSGLIAYQIAYQRGKNNYIDAIDYFETRTLRAFPNGDWTNGARYNLARALEASGHTEDAIRLYQTNALSPGYLGELLRAKWLQKEAGK
jgi:hypothetical protein